MMGTKQCGYTHAIISASSYTAYGKFQVAWVNLFISSEMSSYIAILGVITMVSSVHA